MRKPMLIYFRTSAKEVNKLLKVAQRILSNHSREIYQCTRY
ncbi:MAG: hypothetical protein DDT22_00951 [candidate division WS2 bacterium]|nr:hypothetical protein [Candidatus Lithacetigena glycinireducens]